MKITVIGGGTGTTTVLSALKRYADIELNVIVTMMDDGGSNAVVRDEFGVLPLSDLRKSILALSSKNKDEVLRQLFMYRFSKGNGLSGHTLGNLIMLALTDIAGSEQQAVDICSDIFSVDGRIIPVTLEHTRLVAQYSNNRRIVGEHNIDALKINSRLKNLSLTENVKANPQAIDSILSSDYVIVGPGDLYTSIIPNLLVDGISKAIKRSKAQVLYIGNIMSKGGETRGLTQSQIFEEISDYLGKNPSYLLLNNGKISQSILERYMEDGEHILENDIERISKKYPKTRIYLRDLISNTLIKRQKGDTLNRSLIRHDVEKLSVELYAVIRKNIFTALSELISKGIS